MKISFKGNQDPLEMCHNFLNVLEEFAEKAGVDELELDNTIIQTSFNLPGQEHPVFMTTEHGEMLHVEVEVEDGLIVLEKDNEDEPSEDKRLWSHERLMNEPNAEPSDVAIESDYTDGELEFIETYEVNEQVTQRIYRIVGTTKELIRYFNMDKHILIAEEVVDKKEEQ